ncbi:MAG: hypothetical protein A4E19_04025 [Nitrospira sp. SG-bin1]|nr:MAG: hypothetical protein A4E19_04025 [Nitrospira sp. SG-bin1]
MEEDLDPWRTKIQSCFRVRAGDGQRYVLRYGLDEDVCPTINDLSAVGKNQKARLGLAGFCDDQ